MQSLYLIPHSSQFLSPCRYLHLILRILSARLSTKFDNEFYINFELSINFNLQDMVFVISSPFLVIFFDLFFSLELKNLFVYLYVALESYVVLQTPLIALLWWNHYHSLIHSEKLQKLSMFFTFKNMLFPVLVYWPVPW